MPWLSDLIYVLTHKKNVDVTQVRQQIMSAVQDDTIKVGNADLTAYVADIEDRSNQMVKDLRKIYKPYSITFTGFKSFATACTYLKDVIKDNNEEAYNNLIKLESMMTSEQQRHLALIRMAATPDGKRVMEQIMQNPAQKSMFSKVFGERGAAGKLISDGMYQQLWFEIHKLSEYILIQKNRIYH